MDWVHIANARNSALPFRKCSPWEKYCLFFIVLIGLLIRLINIDGNSYWNDEIWTVVTAQKSFFEIIRACVSDFHPPLYFLLLGCVVEVFGSDELVTRTVSAIFSSAAVIPFYLCVRRLSEPLGAILSATIFVVTSVFIFYAQEARQYSFLLFLHLCMSLVVIEKHKRTPVYWALIQSIVMSAMLYTHYFSLFLIMPAIAFDFMMVLKKKIDIKSVLSCYMSALVLFAPWLPIFFDHFNGGPSWLTAKSLTDWIQLQSIMLRSELATILLAFTVVLGLLSIPGTGCRSDRYFLLCVLFAGLVPQIFSVFISPVVHYKTAQFAIPAVYIIASLGGKRSAIRWIQLILLVIILFLISYGTFQTKYFIRDDSKQMWRQATKAVISEVQSLSNEVVIFSNRPQYFKYYFDRYSPPHSGGGGISIYQIDQFRDLYKKYQVAYLLIGHDLDKYKKFLDTQCTTYHCRLDQSFKGIWIVQVKDLR